MINWVVEVFLCHYVQLDGVRRIHVVFWMTFWGTISGDGQPKFAGELQKIAGRSPAFSGGCCSGFCVKPQEIPSGKRLYNYGKIHHFQWENPLFQWPCSIAKLNYQRVRCQKESENGRFHKW